MAVSELQEYLLVAGSNKDEEVKIATTTAEKLEARKLTLLDLVQSLGEYINSDDVKIRGSTVAYLTAVIGHLNPKFLSRQQIQVLCQFYCDRIEDGQGALLGLSKLQALDRFNDEMAQITVKAILEHFQDLQTRPQASRFQILSLLNDLMSDNRKALVKMGDEALVGITDFVAGEKDPRNLMLIFSMIRVLMLEWDIGNHAETLFDAVYAYFPITFRPPPNDPYGITAQDLKDRLRSCIASTHHLAPYAIPNLLDKLDSTSTNVKRDVLQTLKTCTDTYTPAVMSQYSITLWDALKFEVLSSQEEDLACDALAVLKGIALNLSKDETESSPKSALAQYLRPLTKECNEHLQEPAQRQAKASGDILQHVSSANSLTFTVIVRAVIPPLFLIYQDVDSIMKKRALLESSNKLLDSCIEVFGKRTASTQFGNLDGSLSPFREKFLEVLSQALMGTVKEEVSFRVVAAKGLLRLCAIRGLLDENETGSIVQQFVDMVLHEESYGRDELKQAAMESLAEISRYAPRLIMDIAFPAFVAKLPDDDQEAETNDEYTTILEGLADISVEREPSETLIRRLLSKVNVLVRNNNYRKPAYTRALLSTILHVMDSRNLKGDSNLIQYHDIIINDLVERAVNHDPASRTALEAESVLDVLGQLCNLVARNLPKDKLPDIVSRIQKLQLVGQHGISAQSSEAPSQASAAGMILSTWLLAGLPPKIDAPGFSTDEITSHVHGLISTASFQPRDGEAVLLSSLRQIALYVNKHLPPKELSATDMLLASTYSSLPTSQEDPATDVEADAISPPILLIFTITKALLLRLAPSTVSHLQRLLTLLSPKLYPESISRSAALAFRTLLLPDPVLSGTNYFVIRKLAPQCLFTSLVPSISVSFRAASTVVEKENYLTALSGILGTVPKDVIMPELSTMLPMLLQSLELYDTAVKLATLQTLLVMISENCGALLDSGHVAALVRRLIKIGVSAAQRIQIPSRIDDMDSRPSSTPPDNPATRRRATYILGRLPPAISQALLSDAAPSTSVNPLLSLKQEVLQSLTSVLDDPRRDVRKEAVDARAAWLRNVDAEEDSD